MPFHKNSTLGNKLKLRHFTMRKARNRGTLLKINMSKVKPYNLTKARSLQLYYKWCPS